MLIAFVGPPCSGKTTTAARVFADLKDAGYAAEFLSEYARHYIAKRRLRGESGPLTNHDQSNILAGQSKEEEFMVASSPESIVVADSAAINALMYMTYISSDDEIAAEVAAKRYDLIFRCSPVRAGSMYDPNRVHSFEDSLRLDKGVESLLTNLNLSFVSLSGSQKNRSQRAYGAILETMVKGGGR